MGNNLCERRAFWLFIPPIILSSIDFGLTLYGQPSVYWAGNYSQANEISPSFATALRFHPIGFVALFAIWAAIFCILILLLPEILALFLTVAIVIGHMLGASTWLAYRFHSYQSAILLILATAGLIVFSFKRGQAIDGTAAFHWERTGLPNWCRWLTIVVLSAIPIWWFVIPH